MKVIKKIICFSKGHDWDRWFWAEDRDYAVTKCFRCGKMKWGCTLGYGRTFGTNFEGGFEIISRRD